MWTCPAPAAAAACTHHPTLPSPSLQVDPLFEQEARQHVCYKTLSELISRGCRGATAVLTEAKAKGGKAKGGKEGQQLQEGGPQPAPHLALARSGLGLMKDLQRMPAGVLLLSPVVAINVGPVAENLGKAAMNEAKPTPKTDGPPLSKLVRYMKGLCKAAGLAPSLVSCRRLGLGARNTRSVGHLRSACGSPACTHFSCPDSLRLLLTILLILQGGTSGSTSCQPAAWPPPTAAATHPTTHPTAVPPYPACAAHGHVTAVPAQ